MRASPVPGAPRRTGMAVISSSGLVFVSLFPRGRGVPDAHAALSVQGQAHSLELPCDLTVSYSLDLDAWINEPPSDSESEDEKPKAIFHDEEQRQAKQRQPEADEEELARVSTDPWRQGFIHRGRWPHSEHK